jgi:hypothetical protein
MSAAIDLKGEPSILLAFFDGKREKSLEWTTRSLTIPSDSRRNCEATP